MLTMLGRTVLFTLLCAGIAGVAMATEEPKYRLIESRDGFELRLYDPVVVAETHVTGEFGSGGNEAFRRLASYIFGGNNGGKKITMTAPVSQERTKDRGGVKIAMTAPVSQERAGGGWTVAFTMPSEHSMKTLPQPDDARVLLREVPARRLAAVRFSGTWGVERFEEMERELRKKVLASGLTPGGPAIYARYDPPWTPWFLRRNEILLPVVEGDNR